MIYADDVVFVNCNQVEMILNSWFAPVSHGQGSRNQPARSLGFPFSKGIVIGGDDSIWADCTF